MRQGRFTAAILALGSALASAQGPDALQGTWKLESIKWAEADKTTTIALTSMSHLIITSTEMIQRDENDGKVTDTKFSYKLDTKKTPAVCEKTALDGKNKGKTFASIWVIEGDTLKMCDQAKGLPANFTITQGQDVKDKYLYTYKKIKK